MQAFLHGQIMFSVFFYRSCLWSTFWIDLSLWLYFHDLWHCILKNNWDTTGDLLVGEIFEKYQNILLAFLQIAYLSWMSRTEMARSVSLPPTILSMMRDLIPGTISKFASNLFDIWRRGSFLQCIAMHCNCTSLRFAICFSWNGHYTVHKNGKKWPEVWKMWALSFSLYPARALGLLLADGAPTVGWGKTFWRVGRFFLRKQP